MSGIHRLFASSLQGLAPGLPDPGAAARDRLVFTSGAGVAETRPLARGAGMGVEGEDFAQPLETRVEKARRSHALASVGGVGALRSSDATSRPDDEMTRRERLGVEATPRQRRRARSEP